MNDEPSAAALRKRLQMQRRRDPVAWEKEKKLKTDQRETLRKEKDSKRKQVERAAASESKQKKVSPKHLTIILKVPSF